MAGGVTEGDTAGFATGWPQWLAWVGAERLLDRTTPLIGDTMAVILALTMRDAGSSRRRSPRGCWWHRSICGSRPTSPSF